MKISKSARREAKQLFRNCFVSGVLDDARVQKTAHKIAESKPRDYMAMLAQLERLVRLEVERRTARVESAAALAPELVTKITNDLNRLYGPGLNISFTQEPALVGGLRIKVGSDVYDSSIQGRLRKLSERF
jgi:F-type H+-transporting ATPase subunit delta